MEAIEQKSQELLELINDLPISEAKRFNCLKTAVLKSSCIDKCQDVNGKRKALEISVENQDSSKKLKKDITIVLVDKKSTKSQKNPKAGNKYNDGKERKCTVGRPSMYKDLNVGTYWKKIYKFDEEVVESLLMYNKSLEVFHEFGNFPCMMCNEVLEGKTSLFEHTIRNHYDKKQQMVECNQCSTKLKCSKKDSNLSRTFALECFLSKVYMHFATVHLSEVPNSVSILTCGLCSYRTLIRDMWYDHLRTKHSIKPKIINIRRCSERTIILLNHLQQILLEPVKISDHPWEEFMQMSTEKNELRNVVSVCTLCRSNWKDSYESYPDHLLDHVLKDHSMKIRLNNCEEEQTTLSCPCCDTSFLLNESNTSEVWRYLIEHTVTVHGQNVPACFNVFYCLDCSYFTLFTSKFIDHFETTHRGKSNKGQIHVCPTDIYIVYLLIVDADQPKFQRNVTIEQPHKNQVQIEYEDLYKDDFKSDITLAESFTTNADIYQCIFCSNNFTSLENLLQHFQQLHILENFQVQCPCDSQCMCVGNATINSSELLENVVEHCLREHTDFEVPPYVKLFQCQDCNFRTIREKNYYNHLKDQHHFMSDDDDKEIKLNDLSDDYSQPGKGNSRKSRKVMNTNSSKIQTFQIRNNYECYICQMYLAANKSNTEASIYVADSSNSLLQHWWNNHCTKRKESVVMNCCRCDKEFSAKACYKSPTAKAKTVGLKLIQHYVREHKTLPPKYLTIYRCELCEEDHILRTSFYDHYRNKHSKIPDDLILKTDPESGQDIITLYNADSANIGAKNSRPLTFDQFEIKVGDEERICEKYRPLRSIKELFLSIEVYKCFLCENELDCLQSLISHLKQKHVTEGPSRSKGSDIGLKCLFCKKFVTFDKNMQSTRGVQVISLQLLHHMIFSHSSVVPEYVKFFQCNQCNYYSVSPEVVRHHEYSHSLSKVQVVCEFCNSLVKKSSIVLHRCHCERKMKKKNQTQTEETCSQCKSKFNSQEALSTHWRRRHGNSSLKHQCEVCGKSYYSKKQLELHMFNQHSLNPNNQTLHECKECNYKSISLMAMKKHIWKHDIGNYVCSVCSKTCQTLGALISHETLRHNVEHSCCKCDLKSTSALVIAQHYMTKHQIKLQCEECLTELPTRHYFKCHMNVQHGKSEELTPPSTPPPTGSIDFEFIVDETNGDEDGEFDEAKHIYIPSAEPNQEYVVDGIRSSYYVRVDEHGTQFISKMNEEKTQESPVDQLVFMG